MPEHEGQGGPEHALREAGVAVALALGVDDVVFLESRDPIRVGWRRGRIELGDDEIITGDDGPFGDELWSHPAPSMATITSGSARASARKARSDIVIAGLVLID